jgi:hypothetical protein
MAKEAKEALEEDHGESNCASTRHSAVRSCRCWYHSCCSNDSQPCPNSTMRASAAPSHVPAPGSHRHLVTDRNLAVDCTIAMENPPLASLSLTHVHYVYLPAIRLKARLMLVESRRPHLVPLRMAGPRTPRTMRCIRDPDMEQP